MKAAVLHMLGETPRYESFPSPALEAGEVLVSVTAAPQTALDRTLAAGTHYGKPDAMPYVVGVTGAGVLADGRRVLFGGVRAPYGTMAEQAAASSRWLFPLADGIDDALAAAAFNPGLSAWLALNWRLELAAGMHVLVLGATGVTGQCAVQFARGVGAGRIVAAGRNARMLAKLRALGADATVDLTQPDTELEAAFAREAGEQPFDVVIDYLWGHPTEVLLRALTHGDLETRASRTRLLQVGEMAGPEISLPAAALRSGGVEILGQGTGTVPPGDVLGRGLDELMRVLADGELEIEIERVPLAHVADVWNSDHSGRRPVFIP